MPETEGRCNPQLGAWGRSPRTLHMEMKRDLRGRSVDLPSSVLGRYWAFTHQQMVLCEPEVIQLRAVAGPLTRAVLQST